MAIKFKDKDGTIPISEKQFTRLKVKGGYRLSDDEYDSLETVLGDAGLEYIAVKQAEIAGVTYDFIYDMEEEILYNLKDGVALVNEAAEIEYVSDDEPNSIQHHWKKLLLRLGIHQ